MSTITLFNIVHGLFAVMEDVVPVHCLVSGIHTHMTCTHILLIFVSWTI